MAETATYVFLLAGAATSVAIVVPNIVGKSDDIHKALRVMTTPSAPPSPPAHPSPPGHPPPSPFTPPSAPPPTAGRRLAEIVTSMKKVPSTASTYKFTHAEMEKMSL